MAIIAPLVLLGLGWSGFVVAGKAVQPIEESFDVLKRFLADAGHELKTPVAIIQANAEAMEAQIENNKPALEKVSVIEKSAERMGNLITDLMLLSRMETPMLLSKKEPVELDEILNEVLREFAPLFSAKRIIVETLEIDEVQVMGQSEPLRRMVNNLLENALRYTNESGNVTVTLQNMGRTARLVIADNGIGIPADSIDKIFDRFYRVDKSRSRIEGGSGLGLSIVKVIAESHHGKVEAESATGVGSKFTVVLPTKILT